MNTDDVAIHIRDNGGRRSGFDRRQFSYSGHIPERRELPDRRSGADRRNGTDRRQDQKTPDKAFIEMRSGAERRSAFAKEPTGRHALFA